MCISARYDPLVHPHSVFPITTLMGMDQFRGEETRAYRTRDCFRPVHRSQQLYDMVTHWLADYASASSLHPHRVSPA